ncbi:MAG TPA: hypothetical protein VGG88_11745, partial [Gaiellaceae bacterium]
AVIGGAVILFPSLALLFRLTLRGDLDPGRERAPVPTHAGAPGAGGARIAVAFLVGGIGLLTVANAPWAHAIGVACFFGFALAAYSAVAEEPSARSESVDGTK